MIRELLKRLTTAQYKQLRYAHEQGIAQYIELDDDIFVGVNVGPLRHLEILELVGVWAYGRIR
ncbi:hypothetical protein LCGC14_0669680 [marine sediment metagenome]|uniref:Uncharacterized protein n=1 Tax=marine sediment metagenome TaxID=412755 RepID=A0A0F9QWB7_9ZZZZ